MIITDRVLREAHEEIGLAGSRRGGIRRVRALTTEASDKP
jgi:hypothetical protein